MWDAELFSLVPSRISDFAPRFGVIDNTNDKVIFDLDHSKFPLGNKFKTASCESR
jgi:hypothetical protein